MKNCPKCNLELPSQAHFCPRCMYEYPRTEKHIKRRSPLIRKKRFYIIISILVVMLLQMCWPLTRVLQPKNDDKQTSEQNQPSMESTFHTNETSVDNPEVIHDFENILFAELHSVSQILGEEIVEAYPDAEYMVHEFESVMIEVSSDEKIKSIYIDYSSANDEIIEQYGIHGINGKTSREQVQSGLGTPEQNFDEEWCYRFDGERGIPSLRVFFDENGMVTALQYYTLQ